MADQTTTTSTSKPRDTVAESNQMDYADWPDRLMCAECHEERAGLQLERHVAGGARMVTCSECLSILWRAGRTVES